ncbi:MAG: hypothetical protein A2284_12805, partial [Deltaproteobacteria bacterium RIFOXYA12_FULL_61_11]
AEAVLDVLELAGIETSLELRIGFPGEEQADLDQTLAFLSALRSRVSTIASLETVTIAPDSMLERRPYHFGVVLPAKRHVDHWRHEPGNDLLERERRLAWTARQLCRLDFEGCEHHVRPSITGRDPSQTGCELLLTTMPPSGVDSPPIGLAYLAEYLQQHGVPTLVYDFNAHLFNLFPISQHLLWHVENKNYWSNEQTFGALRWRLSKHLDRFVDDVLALRPTVIGFSVCDPKERCTIEAIRRLRQRNKDLLIVLGGPACFTSAYRQIFVDQLGPMVDAYCVHGEGEEILLEVLQRVRNGKDLRDLPGLLVYDEHRNPHLTPRQHLRELDRLPFPTYRDFDHSLYQSRELLLEWSRGCISRCKFCKGVQICGRFRPRSPERKLAELLHHHHRYGTTAFTVVDLVLNGDMANLEATAEAILASGLKLSWRAEALPLPGMSDDLLAKLRASGLTDLQLGIESGSDHVLKMMNKYFLFDTATAEDLLRRVHAAGIRTALFWQVGYPGEGEKEFHESYEFLRRNAAFIDELKSINETHVITETPLHQQAARFGLTLPERDYHYLWSMPGNDHEVRTRRTKALLRLCREQGIFVRETNLSEGKHYRQTPPTPDRRGFGQILHRIGRLQSFNDVLGEHADSDEPGGGPDFPMLRRRLAALGNATLSGPARNEKHRAAPAALHAKQRLRAARARTEVETGPAMLEMDLTTRCNFDCSGCWSAADRKVQGVRELPLPSVLTALRTAADLGVETVQLSGGGEPFLYPGLFEVIAESKRLSLHCRLVTNLSLFDPTSLQQLIDLRVDQVTVSLWAADHASFRTTHPRSPLSLHDRVRENLRTLLHLRKEKNSAFPLVKLYVVVTAAIHDRLVDLFEFGR